MPTSTTTTSAWKDGLAQVVRHLLWMTPPKLGSRSLPDLLDQLRFAWKLRGLGGRGVADLTRIMTMSAADLLDDWFESDRIKAGLSIDGIIGTWAGPYEPGTAYVLLHHEIGSVDEDEADGPIGGWGFVEGGMGAVSTNLAAAVEEYGGQVRLNAPVARILVDGDRAVGVVSLESGEEIRSDLVISNAHPQLTFLRLIEERQLPAEFVTDIRNYDSRSGTVKVNLAISELPNFASHPGDEPPAPSHRGDRAGPFDEYIQQAFDDARQGRGSAKPYCDGVIASTLDHTLAPGGDAHLLDVRPVGAPGMACRAPSRAEVEAFADRLIDGYNELAPNLEGLDRPPPGDQPVRHGARVRPDRREHLPRRADPEPALPHAPGGRLCQLPNPDQGPLPVRLLDPPGRRRDRPARAQRGARDPQGSAPAEGSPEVRGRRGDLRSGVGLGPGR